MAEAKAATKTIGTSIEGITMEPNEAGEGLPLFIYPNEKRLSNDHRHFLVWFKKNSQQIEELICNAGAIVLRGFPIHNTKEFAALIEEFPSLDQGYAGGATPRQALAEKVFESTRLPAEHKLPLHQEMAYLPKFPSKLAFYCNVASQTGGETIIGDMCRFTSHLPQNFWDAVRERGVLYTRNYRDPQWFSGSDILDSYHRPWTEALGTDNREAAEAKCHEMGIKYRWEPNGSLSVFYSTPGYLNHPVTGELIWFNQIAPQSFIPESIGPERYALYEKYYEPGTPIPVKTTFSDGGEMDPSKVGALHALLDEVTVSFPWKNGDVMFLDNFKVAHGRNPFTGKRDVQVALIA